MNVILLSVLIGIVVGAIRSSYDSQKIAKACYRFSILAISICLGNNYQY